MKRIDVSEAASVLGRKGGSAGTEAQNAARRANALKGGRPKTLLEIETFDRHDCASVGYKIAFRDNGTARMEHVSRWQGSRNGQVWIARVPATIMATVRGEVENEEESPELAVLVREWLHDDWQADARLIRAGHVVR